MQCFHYNVTLYYPITPSKTFNYFLLHTLLSSLVFSFLFQFSLLRVRRLAIRSCIASDFGRSRRIPGQSIPLPLLLSFILTQLGAYGIMTQSLLVPCGAAKGTKRNCTGSLSGSFPEQDLPAASSAGLTTMAGCGLYGGRAYGLFKGIL